jgi:hypothetical protein
MGKVQAVLFSFRSWIRSRRRYITIVGSLIVLLTYFVRDEKREELRELITALQTAEDEEQLREDNERVTTMLREQGSQLNVMQNAINARPQTLRPPTPDDLIQEHLGNYFYDDVYGRQDVEAIQSKLDRVRRIAKSLPNNRLYDSDIQRVESEIAENKDELAKLAVYVVNNQQIHPAAADRAYIASSDFMKKLSGVETGLYQADHNATRIVENAIGVASKTLEHDDAEVKKLNILSYFLFTIGWTLALADRIFGLDEPIEAE